MIHKLFEEYNDTIVDSCLSGIMGEILVGDTPGSAAALLGDFCFPAGIPDAKLIDKAAQKHGNGELILAPKDETWIKCIENAFAGRLDRGKRYAISREDHNFDRERLKTAAASLPGDYTLRFIDEDLYQQCLKEDWCRDFVWQYSDWAMFRDKGLGVVALKDGMIAAGASSYSTWSRGIEIEVDTREEHRRRGLAYACSAALILACLERGWNPGWDAANLSSVALAEKLGYTRAGEYPIWVLKIDDQT